MDYLVIGSNGFAQVGYPDFHTKNRIEMRVLLEYLQNNYPIQDEFSHMCDYRVKWFTHDFGRYSEIVLIYDNYILDCWNEDDPDKFDRFWDWFNDVESVNFETEILTKEIKSKYQDFIRKTAHIST